MVAHTAYTQCIITANVGFCFLKDSRIQLRVFLFLLCEKDIGQRQRTSLGHSIFLVLSFLEQFFEAEVAQTSK